MTSLIEKKAIRNSYNKEKKTLFYTNSGIQIEWEDIIKSYRGKYLYIDFWASWCQPCRFEMPLSIRLSQEFNKNEIAFIYISIDEKAEDWEKASSQIGLRENNNSFLLLNMLGGSAKKYFNINEIPRYLIFDEQGRLINNDAPRPSNPNCERILRNLINRKNVKKRAPL